MAARTIRESLCRNVDSVVGTPEEALTSAFGEAHAAIRAAMLAAPPKWPSMRRQDDYLLAWMESEADDGDDGNDDDGSPPSKWDAVDGGTTASVALVIGGTPFDCNHA